MSFGRISIGDIPPGAIEAPRPNQLPTNFVAWRIPDIGIITQIHGPQVPDRRGRCYERRIVDDLPQLGGFILAGACDECPFFYSDRVDKGRFSHLRKACIGEKRASGGRFGAYASWRIHTLCSAR